MNSDPATVIEAQAAWSARLLQAGDSFYPTGAYAHSFGLEGLVDAGLVRDAETLAGHFRECLLPALAYQDLPLTVHAWDALAEPDWGAVGELSTLAQALKATRETREASARIGRQRVEMLARLHPESLAPRFVAEAERGGWPHAATIAAALEGRVHGAPIGAVLGGLVYAALSGQVAAAMKVLRLGQNAAQQVLTAAVAETPRVVRLALTVERSRIGWFNPWLDIASARHETAAARLFIS